MKVKHLFAAAILSLLALVPGVAGAQGASIVSDGGALGVFGGALVILIASGQSSTTGTTK